MSQKSSASEKTPKRANKLPECLQETQPFFAEGTLEPVADDPSKVRVKSGVILPKHRRLRVNIDLLADVGTAVKDVSAKGSSVINVSMQTTESPKVARESPPVDQLPEVKELASAKSTSQRSARSDKEEEVSPTPPLARPKAGSFRQRSVEEQQEARESKIDISTSLQEAKEPEASDKSSGAFSVGVLQGTPRSATSSEKDRSLRRIAMKTKRIKIRKPNTRKTSSSSEKSRKRKSSFQFGKIQDSSVQSQDPPSQPSPAVAEKVKSQPNESTPKVAEKSGQNVKSQKSASDKGSIGENEVDQAQASAPQDESFQPSPSKSEQSPPKKDLEKPKTPIVEQMEQVKGQLIECPIDDEGSGRKVASQKSNKSEKDDNDADANVEPTAVASGQVPTSPAPGETAPPGTGKQTPEGTTTAKADQAKDTNVTWEEKARARRRSVRRKLSYRKSSASRSSSGSRSSGSGESTSGSKSKRSKRSAPEIPEDRPKRRTPSKRKVSISSSEKSTTPRKPRSVRRRLVYTSSGSGRSGKSKSTQSSRASKGSSGKTKGRPKRRRSATTKGRPRKRTPSKRKISTSSSEKSKTPRKPRSVSRSSSDVSDKSKSTQGSEASKSTQSSGTPKATQSSGKARGRPRRRSSATSKGRRQRRRSMAQKSGLIFPPVRVGHQLKDGGYTGNMCRKNAKIMLAAVLERLTFDLLEIAGDKAKEQGKQRIQPIHISEAVMDDDEFYRLFRNVDIPIDPPSDTQ